MKSLVRVNFIVFVLALFAVTKGYAEEDSKYLVQEQDDYLGATTSIMQSFLKLPKELDYSPGRRSQFGAHGMFSSPRIGRSDPTLMYNLHETEAWLNDLYSKLYDDYEDSLRNYIKRASYVDLPRVGRSDPETRKFAHWLQKTLNKRAAKPNVGARMFDYPRTGKRSVDAKTLGQKDQI